MVESRRSHNHKQEETVYILYPLTHNTMYSLVRKVSTLVERAYLPASRLAGRPVLEKSRLAAMPKARKSGFKFFGAVGAEGLEEFGVNFERPPLLAFLALARVRQGFYYLLV